ncbi:MAG: DUF1232 domain-containing protein [Akkermansia sp.]|nr:DUF1232 domain-containing protein [Akkermansia sp.]
MNKEFINNISDLENSRWMKEAQNPATLETLEKQVLTWLSKIPASNKLMQTAQKALQLFASGRKGELLTPRNYLLLGASLLYLVCPADAIADIIPIIGLADDLGVLTLALNCILSVANRATTQLKTATEVPAALSTTCNPDFTTNHSSENYDQNVR